MNEGDGNLNNIMEKQSGKLTVVLRESKRQILTIEQNHLQPARPTAVQDDEQHWQNIGGKGEGKSEGKILLQDFSEVYSNDKHAIDS